MFTKQFARAFDAYIGVILVGLEITNSLSAIRQRSRRCAERSQMSVDLFSPSIITRYRNDMYQMSPNRFFGHWLSTYCRRVYNCNCVLEHQ